MDDSDVFPPGGEDDVDGPVPDPFKINQMMDDDDAQPPMPPSGGDGPDLQSNMLDPDEDEEDEEEQHETLPLFANQAARELHAEILKHKEHVEQHDKALSDHKEGLGIVEEHLKNVAQEVTYTTGLVNAKKKEIESEDHLTQLTIREGGRYHQEIARLSEKTQEIEDKLNMAQNHIFQGNEKMDTFKLEMNWNQEELEQWVLAAKQKEDDNLALQKYTRADEVKIKELNLTIEKLTQGVMDHKTQLENEQTETQARQIELDRTAEEFRALHADRRKLVQQWQDTIEAMQRRDGTIAELSTKYAEQKREHAEKIDQLQQHREHLKGIEDDNADVQTKSTMLERQVSDKRMKLQKVQEDLQAFNDELDVLKSELGSCAASLMKKRSENQNISKSLDEKKMTLEETRRTYQTSKKHLEDEALATKDAELSAKDAETALQDQEDKLKAADHKLAVLKDQMFRQSQQLFVLRQEEANLIAEISGASAAARNLQSKIRNLDQESMRQQELIYNAEFQIQQMERKVARGLGERSDEEKNKLNAEIAHHEAELEGARDKKKMLVAQCRKLNNELRAAIRARELAVKSQTDLEAQIAQLEIENLSEEQSVATFVGQKEELMVQNDVMRLELKRLRDALNSKADKVFSLENRRQQLALSMEERKQEISVHQDVQRAQLRAAEEERHRVTVELGGRKQAVEKLRDKYETLVKVSGVRQDEGNGEPKSQAFYLIAAAQKREELQREGDELDQLIQKASKEIKALDYTLKHLNDRNGVTRAAHQRADMAGPEAEKLRSLEEQAKLAQDALFKRKKELQRLQTDYEEDSRRVEQVQQQAARLEERAAHLENAQGQMASELETQKDAVEKTDKRVMRMSGAHRDKQGAMSETLQEKEFRMEEIRESNQNLLYTIGQLAKEYPEIKDALHAQLQMLDLEIPTKPHIMDGDRDEMSSIGSRPDQGLM